ncbi:phosphotransferase [Aliiroseovarius sp.]|uniref:phosphotransferase n=1 Tax=Aliiroseovarius sp. TaxID=1872442 RepID=UPI0026216958|nr:phosphotransferase [Aliiroseovarius sp.]
MPDAPSPDRPTQPGEAPAALKRHWQVAGQVAPDAVWTPLTGGRTNPIWRIDGSMGPLVCKLFLPEAATPLFANDPAAEWAALRALAGTAIAPEPVASSRTALGDSLLYRHVPGRPWKTDPPAVAGLLRRLHDTGPPRALPRALPDATGLAEQGRAMLAQIGTPGALPLPPAPEAALQGAAFLHGDPIPGNLLQAGGRLTLIDWQCPAIGDPCLDLALFLSPAMQQVNGNVPFSPEQQVAFLEAYGDTGVTRRYRALAPLFHWRMAAYCLWKAQHGDAAYAQAMPLELAASEQG